MKEYITYTYSADKVHIDKCSDIEHLFSLLNLILNDVSTHEFRLNLVHQKNHKLVK